MLAEELFYNKQFSDCLKLLDTIQQMFPKSGHELALLAAVISRHQEKQDGQPHVLSNDHLKRVLPESDDEKVSWLLLSWARLSNIESNVRKHQK